MRASRRQVLGTALVMVGTFVAAMDVSVVGTAMPTIIGELGGIDRYGWVFSAYLLTSTVVTPVFGRLADMYGRKLIYFGALIAFVSFSMLAGTSTSIDQLIWYRALQGIGAGALLPTGFTIVADLYDRRTRAKVIGVFSTVWVGAAIVGPAIGAFITQAISWRWTFYVNLPIGLVALAILVAGYRDVGALRRERIDWAGAATFAVAATALMLALNGVAPIATVPLALLCAVAFVRIERSSSAPMIDLELVGAPLIAASIAMALVTGALQFGVTSFVPPFVQGVQGGQPAEAGLALGAMSIGWSGGATVAGWLLLRTGVRAVVVGGSVMLLAALAALAAVPAEVPIVAVGALAAIAGIGMGWTSAPIMVTVQTSVGYAQRGTVTSLVQFARTLGGATGVAALGSLLTASLGPAAGPARVLLDPLERATVDAAGLAPIRDALSGGLHAVFAAMAVVAVAGVVLSRRLPREMPAEVGAEEATAAS